MAEQNANTRFETLADLYYRRFLRLAPGKSEAPETGLSSCSEENRAQFNDWFGRLALEDAVDRIAFLERKVEAMENDCDCD